MVAKRADSIRSLGKTIINVDKVTRAKYKQLAGDMPLIDYLRQLADRELASRQGELMPVDNTIGSIKRDTSAISQAISRIVARINEPTPPHPFDAVFIDWLSGKADGAAVVREFVNTCNDIKAKVFGEHKAPAGKSITNLIEAFKTGVMIDGE